MAIIRQQELRQDGNHPPAGTVGWQSIRQQEQWQDGNHPPAGTVGWQSSASRNCGMAIIRQQELCPVHRGFIAMSGSSQLVRKSEFLTANHPSLQWIILGLHP
jgi:hypothetical protein